MALHVVRDGKPFLLLPLDDALSRLLLKRTAFYIQQDTILLLSNTIFYDRNSRSNRLE